MIDDPNVIKQRDPQGALEFIGRQPEQLAHNFGISTAHFANRHIESVVFAGMGGSSLVAELAHTWPELDVPYLVWKNYDLPKFVNRHTLVICSSYSGNTEEPISAYEAAQHKGAQIAVIAGGGKLADLAKKHGNVLAQVPPCPQPRLSVFYMYRALVEILIAAKLAPGYDVADIMALIEPLQKAMLQWAPDMPKGHNDAKKVGDYMLGKTPIIYAGPLMYPAAYKWKIDVNENAKNTAWCNAYSEFNHNEFLGWTSHPVDKPFAVIDLVSPLERPRILKRFDVADRLLSGLRPRSIRLSPKGKTPLEHLLYFVLFGDYATTYLAILNGVNPTPVALIEKFKKELGGL